MELLEVEAADVVAEVVAEVVGGGVVSLTLFLLFPLLTRTTTHWLLQASGIERLLRMRSRGKQEETGGNRN